MRLSWPRPAQSPGRQRDQPARRPARRARRPRRRSEAGHRLLRGAPRPGRGRPAGVVRDLRPSRLRVHRDVQRGPHRGHYPGDLRIPRRARHQRAALPRRRHARAVRAGPSHRSGGAGRQRRPGAARRARRVHADPGPVPGDPGPQRFRPGAAGRRDRGHPVAQPALRRRVQVQPAGRRAGTNITRWIQDRANALLAEGLAGVRRIPYARAITADTTGRFDFLDAYTSALGRVVDLDAIKAAGVRIGADPLGGASVAYWGAIGERYGLDLTVVNPAVDPTFRFMTLDWDGKIRMDCSSPSAMAGLIARQHDFTIATGNDTDADRHGIVTPDGGLLNPNHYLAVAIDYLYRHRNGWRASAAVGKTLVSSSMIDRVADGLGRRLLEVLVGFKWFVPGLLDGSVAFGGEESAGASFLQHDGSVWTTDKDGIILALLASEITAVTGKSPSELYCGLTARYGDPAYARIDTPATRAQKAALGALSPEQITADRLAGEKITAALTTAPGNGAPIGGLKVVSETGWFAARPSGTEDVYKLYAESFRGPEQLAAIQEEARAIVAAAIG